MSGANGVLLGPDGAVLRSTQAPPESAAATRALSVFGSVVAPTTLLTALMFYFGLLHAYWFFLGFGVEYTVMGLSTQDYLQRSVDGLFLPLTVLAAAGLVAVVALRAWPGLRRVLAARRVRRRVAVAVGVLGLGLLGYAAFGLLTPPAAGLAGALPGVALALGVVVVDRASRELRPAAARSQGAAAAEWAAVFLLVSVGLFWFAGNYSASVGSTRAAQVVASLPAWPDTTVVSAADLGLAARDGVWVCAPATEGAPYRYRGLKLIVQTGGQYLLLPAGWRAEGSVAIVLPRSESLRLEFAAPSSATPSC